MIKFWEDDEVLKSINETATSSVAYDLWKKKNPHAAAVGTIKVWKMYNVKSFLFCHRIWLEVDHWCQMSRKKAKGTCFSCLLS